MKTLDHCEDDDGVIQAIVRYTMADVTDPITVVIYPNGGDDSGGSVEAPEVHLTPEAARALARQLFAAADIADTRTSQDEVS